MFLFYSLSKASLQSTNLPVFHQQITVYLRNNDLDNNQNKNVNDYEMLKSVTKCFNDTKRIQMDRDLWRIYGGSHESRNKQLLLNQGFEFRNTTALAFETNPFSAGTSSPSEDVLKITITETTSRHTENDRKYEW